jgi:hypothetical protein
MSRCCNDAMLLFLSKIVSLLHSLSRFLTVGGGDVGGDKRGRRLTRLTHLDNQTVTIIRANADHQPL